jgi:OmpA family
MGQMKPKLRLFAAALLLLASPAFAQDGRVYEVLFAFDRSDLDAEANATIDQAVADYRQTGAASLAVEGHTDTSGSDSYNQALSERRAEAVRHALVARGVPAGDIRTNAVGENDPAVPTGDGVRLEANRRVTIALGEPAPAPVAAAPAPQPEPEPDRGRLSFLIAPYYGHSWQDERAYDDQGHLVGLNLIASYDLLDQVTLEAEQAGFYQFAVEKEGFGGRSAIGLNYIGLLNFLPGSQFVPYVGANFGGIYGDGIEDSLFAGPEIGVRLGPVEAKVAYDIPFDRDSPLEDGVLSATLGFGLRF